MLGRWQNRSDQDVPGEGAVPQFERGPLGPGSRARVGAGARPPPARLLGGRVSEIEVGEFLARGGRGPEHAELLRLIGTLVDGGEETPDA